MRDSERCDADGRFKTEHARVQLDTGRAQAQRSAGTT